MLGLIKTFAKGLLYVITLPLVLVIFAFYAVIGLIAFIVLSIKSVILFFQGKTIYSELPEDIKAREIMNKNIQNDNVDKKDEIEIIQADPGPIYVFGDDRKEIPTHYEEPKLISEDKKVEEIPLVHNEPLKIKEPDFVPEPEPEIEPFEPIEEPPLPTTENEDNFDTIKVDTRAHKDEVNKDNTRIFIDNSDDDIEEDNGVEISTFDEEDE